MDTKLIFKLTKALCDGIYTPQSMSQRIREATNEIKNNITISDDQVNDLELSCLILHEYIKNHPGNFNLSDSVAHLLYAMDKRHLTKATVGHYNKTSSMFFKK